MTYITFFAPYLMALVVALATYLWHKLPERRQAQIETAITIIEHAYASYDKTNTSPETTAKFTSYVDALLKHEHISLSPYLLNAFVTYALSKLP